MKRSWALLHCLALLLCIILTVGQSYDDTNGVDYYDDYELYNAGYAYDMYDDAKDGIYFNQYTGDYDDVYGDYFFEEDSQEDCRIKSDGKVEVNGTKACDLKVEGADKYVELLSGGLDGVYKVFACENGRPMYKRDKSPTSEDRVLWFSSKFGDWDVNNGTAKVEDDILLYGGGSANEIRPQFVPKDKWNVAADFKKSYDGFEDYLKIDLKVTCADGSVVEPPKTTTFGKSNLLTDAEIEKKYSSIYRRNKKAEAPGVNMGLVSLFVFAGLGIVFGLPYLVARQRKSRKDGSVLYSLVGLGKKADHAA